MADRQRLPCDEAAALCMEMEAGVGGLLRHGLARLREQLGMHGERPV